jgi:hypothetical protein
MPSNATYGTGIHRETENYCGRQSTWMEPHKHGPGGGTPVQPGHPALVGLTRGTPTNTILESLQLLIQQSQTQRTIMPACPTKKPSEHWEGMIDLLLCLVGVNTEDDLPPIWQA